MTAWKAQPASRLSSRRFVSRALRYGAGVASHLSNLRPKGFTEMESGLSCIVVPVSFGKLFLPLNEILRRGVVAPTKMALLVLPS